MPNKYKATYVSHSSSSTFKNCPLAYFYSAVYKDADGDKISTVSPHLTLGVSVHEPLEALMEVPSDERKNTKFAPLFFKTWESLSGEKGGFKNPEQEEEFKQRGVEMLKRVKANIHHLEGESAFLVKERKELPWFWLSEEEEIILCGKTDVILKHEDCYEVIDFKTGKNQEKDSSLQLPIYRLLLNHYFGAANFRAKYWYLLSDDAPIEKEIPSLEESRELVLDIGRKIKQARADKNFECPRGESGCFACRDYRKIVNGDAKFSGKGIYGAKMYTIL